MSVIAKKFEDVVDRKEKVYGVAYKLDRIDPKDLERWTKMAKEDRCDLMHLPLKNEFIPQRLDLVAREEVFSKQHDDFLFKIESN